MTRSPRRAVVRVGRWSTMNSLSAVKETWILGKPSNVCTLLCLNKGKFSYRSFTLVNHCFVVVIVSKLKTNSLELN